MKKNFLIKNWFKKYFSCFKSNEDSSFTLSYNERLQKGFEFLKYGNLENFFDTEVFSSFKFDNITSFKELVGYSTEGKDDGFTFNVYVKKT